MSALILGATGCVGQHAYRTLLERPEFTRVTQIGRRLEPEEGATIVPPNKVERKNVDYEKLLAGDEEQVKPFKDGRFDTVIIALGTTTTQTKDTAEFFKIDRDYVLAAAAAARVDGLEQRLVYCSSMGADSSSMFPYPKSKGQTQEGLAKLGYEVIIVQPGLLKGRGDKTRVIEKIFGLITSPLNRITPNFEINAREVGQGMIYSAIQGVKGLPKEASIINVASKNDVPEYTIIPNQGLTRIAPLLAKLDPPTS